MGKKTKKEKKQNKKHKGERKVRPMLREPMSTNGVSAGACGALAVAQLASTIGKGKKPKVGDLGHALLDAGFRDKIAEKLAAGAVHMQQACKALEAASTAANEAAYAINNLLQTFEMLDDIDDIGAVAAEELAADHAERHDDGDVLAEGEATAAAH